MAINIILGIGGTGAKIVEAILHSSSLGLGPKSLTIGLVDQDRSNGNVSRTRETFEAIRRARAAWRTSGADHFIGGGDLLRTEVRELGDGLWVPHDSSRVSLAQIVGDLGADKPAFDLLFAKGPLEQEMKLDEGYRGRAHIGSAAITSAVNTAGHFWRELSETIAAAKGGEEVRILLVGSVFGGTGAAGFPTLSRLIRRIVENAGMNRNIRVGGVLMLPYFRFSAPEDVDANVARTEDLLPQTRGALRYYSSLFKREKVFDDLFMVGWNPGFDLGYHRPGTGEQKNAALLPELVAALGAAKFLSDQHEPTENVFVTARREEEAVGWSDLPQPEAGNKTKVYEDLARHVRFLGAWKLWQPILSRTDSAWRESYQKHNWYKKQEIGRIDFQNSPPTVAIDALNEYANSSIKWLASMKAYAARAGLTWNLWNTDPLVEGEARFDRPSDPITVKARLSDRALLEGWEKLIGPLEGAGSLPSAADVHYRMNTKSAPGEHQGLGQFIASLHEFSSVRVAQGDQ